MTPRQVLWRVSHEGFEHRSGDKLVSVLRPLQLVEMRIGEAEVTSGPAPYRAQVGCFLV